VGAHCRQCCADYKQQQRRDDPHHVLFQKKKYAAQLRGVEFTLTPDDVVWQTHCPVLGMALDYSPSRGYRPNKPTFDRLDNAKGYTPENTRIISLKANSTKSDLTVDQITRLLAYMKGEL